VTIAETIAFEGSRNSNVLVDTVPGLSGSLNDADAMLVIATLTPPAVGNTEVTIGGVVSIP
jgi:hypothetical protein